MSEILEQNRQNFLTYNRKKYERFQALIADSDVKKVINSVPLLLSLNNPKVPGYVEGNVPMGIAGYTPDSEIVRFVETKCHVANLQFAVSEPFIEMLAVMGSPGTIAYTKKSDCDYWCCVNKDSVSKESLDKLQQKIDIIQNWVMAEAKTEIHLFLNDIKSLKNNIYAEDEDEAFGSTIGATLKDEFYRSSIIIAGKIPFWWVIPHVDDEQYKKLYAELPDETKNEQYIDLGNMYSIPKEDFMGAALFQLVKALANPFKSILKIGVLEKYLFGPPIPHLLCHKIKESIHKGEFYLQILDSYLLMFEAVYEYYGNTLQDKTLLATLPRNLYLKINPQLTKYMGLRNNKNLPYKVKVMSKYVAQWKWSVEEIKDLDNFDNWDYTKIMTYWNTVKKFMLLSYQKISNEIPNVNLQQKISESDFKLLSSKIKTNFIVDENEIDHYITFRDTPYEAILYIEPTKLSGKESEWRVYKKNSASPGQITILKTKNDLVKLIAWIALNNIFDPVFSRIQMQSGYIKIDQSVVQNLLTDMVNLFNKKKIHLKNEFFLRPPFNTKTMLIVNFNDKESDSISSIYYLYKASWGQSCIYHYSDPGILTTILRIMLTDALRLKLTYDECCAVHAPNPFKKEYKQLDRFFREAYAAIVNSDFKKSVRFVGKLENNYMCITRDQNNQVTVVKHPNIITLLSFITSSPAWKIDYVFSAEDAQLMVLDEIRKRWRRNLISIVYELKGPYVFIFVLNEGGNIFNYIARKDQKEAAIVNLCYFLKESIQFVNKNSLVISLQNEVELVRLDHDKNGKPVFVNDTAYLKDIYQKKTNFGLAYAAAVTRDEQEQFNYSLFVPGASDTPPLAISNLSAFVTKLTKPANAVPFISLIKFDKLKKEEHLLGTGIYLSEKARLDSILAKLGSATV